MNTRQSGFTLIELVMVIVILGILAATALPKFLNLQDDANQAAVDGVAGAMSSAAAINYAQYLANSTATHVTVDTTTACNTLAGLLQEGSFPTGFTIQSTAPTGMGTGAGSTGTCSVTKGGKTASATLINTP